MPGIGQTSAEGSRPLPTDGVHGCFVGCRKRCAHPLAPSVRGLRPQAVGERTVRLPEIFWAMTRFSPSAPSGHLPRRGRFFDSLGAAYMRPGSVRETGAYGKPAGRACPAPTARQPKSVHQRRHPGASAPQKTSPLTPSPQTPLLPPSRRSPPFPPYRRC